MAGLVGRCILGECECATLLGFDNAARICRFVTFALLQHCPPYQAKTSLHCIVGSIIVYEFWQPTLLLASFTSKPPNMFLRLYRTDGGSATIKCAGTPTCRVQLKLTGRGPAVATFVHTGTKLTSLGGKLRCDSDSSTRLTLSFSHTVPCPPPPFSI